MNTGCSPHKQQAVATANTAPDTNDEVLEDSQGTNATYITLPTAFVINNSIVPPSTATTCTADVCTEAPIIEQNASANRHSNRIVNGVALTFGKLSKHFTCTNHL